MLRILFRKTHHLAVHVRIKTKQNLSTFEHAVKLIVRTHKIWLVIKIINMRHIYCLKYPRSIVIKNKL